jgi:hypothetical protein
MIAEMLLFLAAVVQLNVDILASKFNVGHANNPARLYRHSILLNLFLKFGLVDFTAIGNFDAFSAQRHIHAGSRFLGKEFTDNFGLGCF